MQEEIDETFKYASLRGVSEHTLRHYNVMTKFVGDSPVEIGFVYPNEAIKIRKLDEKKFVSVGPMKDAACFGKDKFDPGSKQSITITEGEMDALSVYEMTRGNTAAISVRSS